MAGEGVLLILKDPRSYHKLLAQLLLLKDFLKPQKCQWQRRLLHWCSYHHCFTVVATFPSHTRTTGFTATPCRCRG